MSGGGRPPAAPDYVGAARAQGQENINALRTGAALNRVNQVNPFGSTTYKNLGGDQWEQTTSLSPNQQQILGQSEANQIDLGRIANMRLGQINNQGQFTLDGLPSQVTGVNSTNVTAPSVAQRGVDLSGLGTLPTDFSAERQRAEDALYNRATTQLDPQFQQREDQMRTRLINQGLREGSEAWNTEMGNLDRERTAAYGDARDRAISGGGDEASRMLTDALRTRQQGVSEQFGTGEFANSAAAQELQGELARTGQQFSQGYANAGLQNEGRAAGINERLTERDVPLREFMSMYGGNYQSPFNAGGAANVGSPDPVDYMGAINNQYGAQTDMYNYKQQRNQQNVNTGLSLATIAALAAFSDRRLKQDIRRVGELPSGIPTYRYRFRGEDIERLGVMSDDVRRIRPDAVTRGDDGYDRVNYVAIGAEHLLEAA